VERSQGDPELPWSIRQSAMYHSFDLESGQSFWVNVKGNKLIENRITEAIEGTVQHTRSEAFSASLTTHQLFCDWSAENWRWYINDLENQLQELAGNALAVPIDKPPSPPSSPITFARTPRLQSSGFPPPSRTTTVQSPNTERTKYEGDPFAASSRSTTWKTTQRPAVASDGAISDFPKSGNVGLAYIASFKSRLDSLCGRITLSRLGSFWKPNDEEQPVDNDLQVPTSDSQDRAKPPELPPGFADDDDEITHDNFTFRDLQHVQHIEDKTQEALLVVQLNSGVLEELRQHYRYATHHAEFHSRYRLDCKVDLQRFDQCLLRLEKDFSMLQSRTKTLLNLIDNRKKLVSGSLDDVLLGC
jgi:hypothetical protein